jgi:hypothetical protein
MSKKIQDSVSFAVMSVLVFIVLTLSRTALTGMGGGARITYFHLHWIVLRSDMWSISVSHIYFGMLAALVAASLVTTWILSRILMGLHHKRSTIAWSLFIFVILLCLGFASIQDFAFS